LGNSPAGRLLHAEDGERLFTLSPMMPDYFWTTYRCAPKGGNILFERGASFAFRASFQDAEVFHGFSSHVIDTILTLDGTGFKVLASQPGENEMSRQMSMEELSQIPPSSGVSVDFILPAGFKSAGRQTTFPLPETFFSSLSIRWQKIMGTEGPFDKSIFDRVSVEDYTLSSVAVRLKNNQVHRGCVGRIRYSFAALPEAERAFPSRLTALAPFCGVGYKVAQGMGLIGFNFL
jgi:CRISPR-associated endoribonuclease Cas6